MTRYFEQDVTQGIFKISPLLIVEPIIGMIQPAILRRITTIVEETEVDYMPIRYENVKLSIRVYLTMICSAIIILSLEISFLKIKKLIRKIRRKVKKFKKNCIELHHYVNQTE